MKVLKIGAEWCPGCITMGPRWAELEKEFDWLQTEYFDADDNPDLLEKYGVKDIPSFIFLNKDGEEIKRLSGIVKKERLVELIQQLRDK